MRITEFVILSEIKDEYITLRQDGLTRSQAIEKLMQKYQYEISEGTEDDGLLFWIGLADAQYSVKELSAEVAKEGMRAIDAIEQTDFEIAPSDLKTRREHYSAAPMPEKEKVRRPKKFRCSWKMGDTFAYMLSGSDAEAAGLTGRYVIFRKVDELEFGDGRLLPVLTVTMWDNQELPHNAEQFQRLPMLKLEHGRLGLPSSLFEYRVELIIQSKRELSKIPFIYLGNFANVTMPDDEAIIRHPGMIMMCSLERMARACCFYWKHHIKNS